MPVSRFISSKRATNRSAQTGIIDLGNMSIALYKQKADLVFMIHRVVFNKIGIVAFNEIGIAIFTSTNNLPQLTAIYGLRLSTTLRVSLYQESKYVKGGPSIGTGNSGGPKL